ncbi:MAG: hypothetical protein OXH79_01715 [Boseongicola sp.]|nr:hypothetical protein [Boseongicola sp.]
MTDSTRGKQRGLRCMTDESGTFKVTVADTCPPIKCPFAARHGIEQAPLLRASSGPG